jgi:hypothetical protein
VGSVVGWLIFSSLRYLLSLGVVIFLAFPLLKFVLVRIFKSLPREGASRMGRGLLAFPVVAVLGRQRRARRGDRKSAFELLAFQLAGAFFVSLAIQSFLASAVFTVIFAGFASSTLKRG